jgi:hypothetical protein
MQDSGIWSLLMDSINLDAAFNAFFEIRSFPNLDMVTLLLARGANPNLNHAQSSTTVFETLLEQAKVAGGVEARHFNNLMNPLNKYGWIAKSTTLKLTKTPRLGITVLCRSSPGPTWLEAIYEFLAYGADPTIDLETVLGISFRTQVKANKGLMKAWFGIGNNTMVLRR